MASAKAERRTVSSAGMTGMVADRVPLDFGLTVLPAAPCNLMHGEDKPCQFIGQKGGAPSALSVLFGLVAICAPLVTTVATSPSAEAAVASGDIVFSRNYEIWLRHAADGSTVQLTHNGASSSPDVSPDGSKIVYVARDPNPNITQSVLWVMKFGRFGRDSP